MAATPDRSAAKRDWSEFTDHPGTYETASAATIGSRYVPDGEEGLRCGSCGATILAATVTHSIHLRGVLGGSAGFGEVETEQVPYCPSCEKKPSAFGAPIYYDA